MRRLKNESRKVASVAKANHSMTLQLILPVRIRLFQAVGNFDIYLKASQGDMLLATDPSHVTFCQDMKILGEVIRLLWYSKCFSLPVYMRYPRVISTRNELM